MENPREDDNVGTIACWHRRYTLSDSNVITYLNNGLAFAYNREYFYLGTNWELAEMRLRKNVGAAVVLPIYGYDHGGMDISTKVEPTWYHYNWDGARLGFIFVTADKLRKEYGVQRLTKKILNKAAERLTTEVKTYGAYLGGYDDTDA